MIDNPTIYFIDTFIALSVALVGAYVGAWWGVSLTFRRERRAKDAETITKMEYFSELMNDAIDESGQRIEKIEKLISGLESNPYESYWTDKITSQAIEHFQAALQDDIFASFSLIYKNEAQRGKEAYKIIRRLADNLQTLKDESRKDIYLLKEDVNNITDEIRKSFFDFFAIIYAKNLKPDSLLYQINKELTQIQEDKKNKTISDSRHLFINDNCLVNFYFEEQSKLPTSQRDIEIVKFLSNCQNRFIFLDANFKQNSKQLEEYLKSLKKNTVQLEQMANEIISQIKKATVLQSPQK